MGKEAAEFGAYLREVREASPWTLRKFAEAVKVSPTFISRLERGETTVPKEETILRMAEVLGLDADDLLARAKKVASDVEQVIRDQPVELAAFLRTASGLSADRLRELTEQAERMKKKDQ